MLEVTVLTLYVTSWLLPLSFFPPPFTSFLHSSLPPSLSCFLPLSLSFFSSSLPFFLSFPSLLLSPPPPLYSPQSGLKRMVRHFQFHDWPEVGVPGSPLVLMEFIREIQKLYITLNTKAPIVVHCRWDWLVTCAHWSFLLIVLRWCPIFGRNPPNSVVLLWVTTLGSWFIIMGQAWVSRLGWPCMGSFYCMRLHLPVTVAWLLR